jgi:glucose 1-dehydrogenase
MAVLSGKTVVITGGTRGFGLAAALACAREGATVVVASRSEDSVEQAVETIRQAGGTASGLRCDVGDMAQVEALARHAIDTCGGFEVWVNNAGISPTYGPTIHIPPDEFIATTHTNVIGTYNGTRAAMQHFLPRGTGKLINISGRGARGPVPFQNAYASSKAWIKSFTLALADEYKESGVEVMLFSPGMMLTDMMTDVDVVEGYAARLDSFETVLRMWAYPPEVPAEKVVWLASDATDGKTGLSENVLGPFTMLRGALREGLRRLFGRPAQDLGVEVHTVKSAFHPLPDKG